MSNCKSCPVCKIAATLVLIGAINWGLVGILQYDLVANIFGEMTTISRVIYGAIGVSGLMKIVSCFKDCKFCKK